MINENNKTNEDQIIGVMTENDVGLVISDKPYFAAHMLQIIESGLIVIELLLLLPADVFA